MPVIQLSDSRQLATYHTPPSYPVLTRWGNNVTRPTLTQWVSAFSVAIPSAINWSGNDVLITTDLSQVWYVMVDGVQYGLGTFDFSPPIIRINGIGTAHQIRVVGVPKPTISINALRTNVIPKPYPSFIRSQNWTGQISINRSMESHPSGSIELIAHNSQETALKSIFRNGTEINLWNIPFMVNSIQVSRLSSKKYPIGTIYIQISLQGRYAERGNTNRSQLDKQVFVRELLGNKTYLNLSDLARRVGIQYNGKDVKISYPKDTPNETTTTLRQQLNDFASQLEGFLYWSNSYQVQLKPLFGTPIHPILETEVKDERINYNYAGHGAIVDGIQLTDEYRNRTFNLDLTLSDENSEITVLWEFENATDFFDCTQYPKMTEDTSFFGVMTYASGGNCFDGGGVTKTARKKTSINGQEVEIEEWKFGFQFITKDTYSFYQLQDNGKYFIKVKDSPPDDTSRYWELVEHTITKKEYLTEPKKWLGYLKREIKTGEKQVRFKQESAHETAEIWQEYLSDTVNGVTPEKIALVTDKISCYQWFKAGVNEVTEYTLTPLSDYYSDIPAPPCDPSQEWIEPVFAQITERTVNDFFKRPDPESTKTEPKPDLVMGQKVQERTEIVIVTPQSKTALIQKPEKFNEIRYNSNAEGQDMKYAIRISSVTENAGRPQVHTRLNPYTPPDPQLKQKQEATNVTYVLNSYNSDVDNGVYYDSISFSRLADIIGQRFLSIDSVKTALYSVAKAQLDYLNSKSALTVSLTITWRNDLNEGDMVLWDNQLWLILGINQNQQIQVYQGKPLLTCDQLELSLGRVLRVPMTITTKEKNKQQC